MEGSKTTKRKSPKRRKKKEIKLVRQQPLPPRVTSSDPPRMRNLVLLMGGAANVKDNGPVTGKEYLFHPGQVTSVDARDYSGLLARRTSPKSCCGGKSPPAPQRIYGAA